MTPSRRTRTDPSCAGFSLAELAVAVMIVGILAGLALPNLRQALLRAEAARITSDAHTISMAAYDYLSDNGTFPPGAGYGAVPAALAPYLPENFSFTYRGVQYMWFSFNLPNANNFWKTRNLGILIVNYSNRRDLATAMRAHMGPDAFWSPTMFYFVYRG
ncbi:MAG: type II secretion system protein [Gemmatimonadota bacterium]